MEMVLAGKDYVDAKLVDLKKGLEKIREQLKLVVIQIGEEAASTVYINKKKQMCFEMGIDFELIKFPKDISEIQVIDTIIKLNKNPAITGILVQLPIAEHLNETNIINAIDWIKDVDGLTTINLGKLFTNDGIISCTPKGIVEMLKFYDIDLVSKNIVVIGRSNLVGKPLNHLFLKEDATPTIAHSKTKNLKQLTLNADIVVVAAGRPDLLTADMINKDTIVVDVGINRVIDKIVGDVSPDTCSKAKAYTPVPGGIGLTTIISLIENIIECYYLQQKNK